LRPVLWLASFWGIPLTIEGIGVMIRSRVVY
jgi:hypothetical protein